MIYYRIRGDYDMSHSGYKKVKCPYCSAEYKIPATVTYATCPYCGTTFELANPEEKIEHYLFKTIIDKNQAYRLAKGFASQQIGVAEDIEENSSFSKARIYYVPIYIYEINILTPCIEELEELENEEKEEKNELKLSIHGGEEVEYKLVIATNDLPLPIPPNYYFPARARMYFKPTILKNGIYLQPTKDPFRVFEEIKQPSLRKVIEEAKISCPRGYKIIDESKYVGIAHYPFWDILYAYKGKEYRSIVDAADGTIVYLEYPLSWKGRITNFAGGLGTLIGSSIIGGIVSYVFIKELIPGLTGGAIAALPALLYTAYKLFRFKGIYKYKPGEEAVFLPVR